MADNITDDVLDAILRESDGFWPPARERIQALIREHDATLIEGLASDPTLRLAGHSGVSVNALREKARQRREEQS